MILGEIIISDKFLTNDKIQSLKSKPTINIKTGIEINSEIPTLIIGWNKVKKMFPDDEVSILNKKIRDNLYWTFSPKEDKQEFNENVDEFVDKSYDDFIKDITYYPVEPIVWSLTTVWEVKQFIFLKHKKMSNAYITDDFIYLYEQTGDIIFGIDLKYFKFLRFNIEKLIEMIIENTEDVLIEDYTVENGVYQKYKNYLNKEFSKKFIPLIENSMKKAFF